MIRLRLRYLKGSKEASLANGAGDTERMWDILEPTFPEYGNGLGRRPTMTRETLLAFLRAKGVIK